MTEVERMQTLELSTRPAAGAALGLESPDWVDEPGALTRAYRQAFDSTTSLTVGIEEELLLLQPGSLRPADAVEKVLARLDGDSRFACEFRAAQVELITPAGATVTDARGELASARAFAVERMAGSVRLAAVGTHPVSAGPVEVTPGDRYARIAAEHPWLTWRGLPSGLHVHVAVQGAERALAVLNAARSYVPEIGALAANSPYYGGRDTGLASTRMHLGNDLPRTATPPSFACWDDLAELLAWGSRGGTIRDETHLWWDLRPSLRHCTLEFRVADTQTRVADSGAIAAVCQALVAWLSARYDAGESLPVHDSVRIEENRLRALRYGLGGELADLDTGMARSTRDCVAWTLSELEPFSEELGCRNDFLHAWSLLGENGAERQRRFVSRHGLDGLLAWLVDETEGPPLRRSAQPAPQSDGAAVGRLLPDLLPVAAGLRGARAWVRRSLSPARDGLQRPLARVPAP